jgi:hypothetical protein
MKRFLSYLCGCTRPSRQRGTSLTKDRRVRLGFDTLERRELMSARRVSWNK